MAGRQRQGNHLNTLLGSEGESQPARARTTEPVVSHMPNRRPACGVCPPSVWGLGPGLELIKASLPEVMKPGIAPWICALRDHSSAPYNVNPIDSFSHTRVLKLNRGNAVVLGGPPGRGSLGGTFGGAGGIHPMEGNPAGCMGLPDYLGWQWKSKASIPINAGDFALFQFLNRTAKQPKRELSSTVEAAPRVRKTATAARKKPRTTGKAATKARKMA